MQRLIQKQADLGLKDRPFAELLEIPLGTWTPTKNGHKAVGVRVARAALRFPDISPLATAFLLRDDTDRTVSMPVRRRRRAA